MSFHHLPVQVNPPLIASFCVKCHCFIAASGNEHTLLMAEKMHRCPRQRRDDNEGEIKSIGE